MKRIRTVGTVLLVTLVFSLLQGCGRVETRLLDQFLNEDQTRIRMDGVVEWESDRQTLLETLNLTDDDVGDSTFWPGGESDSDYEIIVRKKPLFISEPDVSAIVRYAFSEGKLVAGEYEIRIPGGEPERFEAVYDEIAGQFQELLADSEAITGSMIFERSWDIRDPDYNKCHFRIPWDASYYTEEFVLIINLDHNVGLHLR